MTAEQCRKRRYKDRVAALLALASTRKRRRPTGKDEARAYRCPACKGWHLTSQRRM